MRRVLRKNTAQSIIIGPFVDATDGVTPETGLSIGQSDIQISKDGAAFAQSANAAGATHLQAGYYQVPFAAADVDTVGVLFLEIGKTGAIPVWSTFMVISEVTYDSLIEGTDFLHVDTREVSGAAPETSAEIGDVVLEEPIADHSGVAGSLAALLNDNLDVAVSSRIAATAAERAAIADAILQRNLAGGSDGGRVVRDALRALRNRIEVDRTGGSFTVYQEDDITVAFSGALTTASGDPVSDFDPS